MMTDPLADMLTRIRNATRIERPAVDMPATHLKQNVARVLKDEGFILDFQVGRPPNLPAGAEQRIVWALNGDFALPVPGTFRLIAAIDNQDSEWTTFRLHVRPQQQAPA